MVRKEYPGFPSHYRMQRLEKDKWTLSQLAAGKTCIMHNSSAELHDIGNGIVCFSLTKGTMHVIDQDALELLVQAIEKAESEFKGMIIGHDGKHFSAGMDLHFIKDSADTCQWSRIGQILQQGQNCFMRIKQSKVPIVAAVCGYTLGGGCELAMHCRAVQAYTDTYMGLVETDIGVIPAWGGAKELLIRAVKRGDQDANNIVQNVMEVFHYIASAKKSSNAEEAIDMGLLHKLPDTPENIEVGSRITMKRDRLLPNAKSFCLTLAENYTPQTEQIIEAPMESLHHHLEQEVMTLIQNDPHGITQHRHEVLKRLAKVLSGYAAIKAAQQVMPQEPQRAEWDKVSEVMVMQTSRDAFMELVQEEEALKKIKAVLA